jgi:hypothetical protein
MQGFLLFSNKKVKFMNYLDLEKVLSIPRIGRYKSACNGDEQKSLELYFLNIEISKDFYTLLSLFEIALRNAINEHYKKHFADNSWLINQTQKGFFPIDNKRVENEYDKLVNERKYSPDKLIAALTFGVWIEMFSSHCFAKGNQTLLKIFPNRQKGINQKAIQKELKEISKFRNKIAHYEPICFDIDGKISVVYAQNALEKTLKYFTFLGIYENVLCEFNKTKTNLEKLHLLEICFKRELEFHNE